MPTVEKLIVESNNYESVWMILGYVLILFIITNLINIAVAKKREKKLRDLLSQLKNGGKKH